jgi:nitric oxide dioxygenase
MRSYEMVSLRSREIIEATLPAVRENALKITNVFYPLMFDRYPEVQAYFNDTHQRQGTQRQALANAVVAYAGNLDRLELLGDAVKLIVAKHASLNILPKHYPIVGECLLDAISIVFGDAATEEVLGAWGEAYQQLAGILIDAEEQVYKSNEEKKGGWRGEREFVLKQRTSESAVITSLYFEPVDGGLIAGFQPGQYVGITVNLDGRVQRRNYSVSSTPGQPYYRISVKREPGGKVSNYLHDALQVGDSIWMTAPVGSFVLENSQRPILLLTGGVGITPAISMLEPALKSGRNVHFFHCAINGDHHAFKSYVDNLRQQYDNLQVTYCYSEPLESDQCHLKGFISKEMVSPLIGDPKGTELYFLGPKPFMDCCASIASSLGIPCNQVHFEFFGPLQTLQLEEQEKDDLAAA